MPGASVSRAHRREGPHPWRSLVAVVLMTLLSACSTPPAKRWPQRSPEDIRTQLTMLIPATVNDREGWAHDIQQSFAQLDLLPSTDNLCAVLAVIEQETGYVANPSVPNLAAIARKEIERRAKRLKIPAFALAAALRLKSTDGRSFDQRIDALRTEKDMSDLFDELIDRVPLGQRLFASINPVNTGGSMQVSIDFAEQHARQHRYPWGRELRIRDEVFTRRGGVYFGIAHLLQYPASYQRHIYRYADFNAGWYASRNAAFQQALSLLSGIELTPDGDLLPVKRGLLHRRQGETEKAVVGLAARLGLSERRIERDLAKQDEASFEQTDTWRAVFAAADAKAGKPLPYALLPRITLHSPKITRHLTTAWFANRVQGRYQQCINRAYQP
ncbi:MAG: DUF1615 domain-containing protein [Xanthomonadales bacterium]|nr:DUF1615 domain-containing protein [Xanthomonadales bacterium]